MVALQLPGQKLAKLAAFLSCRAETVPAERMVAKIVANSVVLAIFLTMCKSSFQLKSRMMPRLGVPCYFFGGLTGPGSLTHPPVVPVRISQMQPPLQCTVVLHAPLQTESKLADVRSCRAETVPAQRTAVAMAASNVFLIVFPMVHSPFQ